MIASLPMYDRPETAAAHDRLWAAIRDRLRQAGMSAPQTLTRDAATWEVWQSPDLLFSQTCGLPFRARLHDRVQLIGTPDFAIDGLAPGYYDSVFVVRHDCELHELVDFKYKILALNNPLSQSGYAAAQASAANLGFQFQAFLPTGGHGGSADAVADGRADIAAIDCITWQLMQRYDPVCKALRVIGRSVATPGLPYITARGQDPAPIAAAFRAALAELDRDDRETLALAGLADIAAAEYLAVPIPPLPDEIGAEIA